MRHSFDFGRCCCARCLLASMSSCCMRPFLHGWLELSLVPPSVAMWLAADDSGRSCKMMIDGQCCMDPVGGDMGGRDLWAVTGARCVRCGVNGSWLFRRLQLLQREGRSILNKSDV